MSARNHNISMHGSEYDQRMLQRIVATSQARQAAMEGTLLRLQPFPEALVQVDVAVLDQRARDALRDATCAVCLVDMCVGQRVCELCVCVCV